jgi:hypothetical protein
MNRLILVGSVLALSTAGLSQSYVSSPVGFENIEGRNNAYYTLGRYPGGHYMFFDGEFRGTPMTLKGVDYRLDNQVHTVSTAMGRSWTSVVIDAAECDTTNLSTTFTANPVTTPTRVFESPVTWPSLIGKPPVQPADWNISFPFKTNWGYTGNQDICIDFVFAGGTLANNGGWTSSQSIYYYLDALDDVTYNEAKSTELGDSGNYYGCNDRGVTHLYGAQVYTTAQHYGSGPWVSSTYRDHLVFYQNGRWFGISRPVITILGIKSVTAGWNFPGVYCNKGYIDTSLPTLVFPFFSDTSGNLPQFSFGAPANGIPVPASVAGVELVTQAAWADSQNGRLLLSSAATLKIPERPPFWDRSALYTWDSTRTTGSGPYWNFYYNPIARYAR